jgi:hypothetical protein
MFLDIAGIHGWVAIMARCRGVPDSPKFFLFFPPQAKDKEDAHLN